MRAGLIGATGLVGRNVLQQLLADADCEVVRVWARREAPLSDAKLDWRQIDFDALDRQADCTALDVVFCCLGTTTAKAGKTGLEKVDLNYVVTCAQAAKAAGVPRFCVVSSLGANCASPVHYSRTKGRMESALVALGFESLEILRPSLLLGERGEHRPGEALGQRLAPLLNRLLIGPLKRFRAIPASEVAAAMVELGKAAESGVHIRYLPLDR